MSKETVDATCSKFLIRLVNADEKFLDMQYDDFFMQLGRSSATSCIKGTVQRDFSTTVFSLNSLSWFQ
jgi:hypothetical protein